MQRASAILEAFVVSVSITSSFSGDATLHMCWGSIPETISIGRGRIKGFVNESQLPWRPRSSLRVQQSGQFQSSEGFIMTTEWQRSRADACGSQHTPVHDPNIVLEYLGRYVHRTALSDKAIVACNDQSVTFNYRDSRDHQRKTMTLPAHEFLRRFLQHIPPKGMHRVRAFGLLNPSQRHTLRQLQLLLAPRQMPTRRSLRKKRKPRCRYCHTETLQLLRRLSPDQCLAFESHSHCAVSNDARGPPSHASLGAR